MKNFLPFIFGKIRLMTMHYMYSTSIVKYLKLSALNKYMYTDKIVNKTVEFSNCHYKIIKADNFFLFSFW